MKKKAQDKKEDFITLLESLGFVCESFGNFKHSKVGCSVFLCDFKKWYYRQNIHAEPIEIKNKQHLLILNLF